MKLSCGKEIDIEGGRDECGAAGKPYYGVHGRVVRCREHAPAEPPPLPEERDVVEGTVVEGTVVDIRTGKEVKRASKVEPPKNVLDEASALIKEREKVYGDAVDSWVTIAEMVNMLHGPRELSPAQEAVATLFCMKLVRHRHSPENPDHLLDAAGYLAIWVKLIKAGK